MPDGSPPPTLAPAAEAPPPLFSRLRLVSLCTLASRILGMARDMGMAAVFGNGVVMDAFSVAFRIPNLVRMLFGEGALTAAFLPVFIRELEQQGRDSAWRLASAVLNALALTLCSLVLLAEAAIWAARTFANLSPETNLLLGLTAALLPYLVLICLAAQVSAVMHALGHFTWPALIPILLNVVWLATLLLIVPPLATAEAKIYAVAACVVVAGVAQFAVPLPALFRLGFRYHLGWRDARGRIGGIARAMLPVVLGLSITQLNTLADSLIAWGFSQPEGGAAAMPLPGNPAYPLEAGTASALYFGQRLYQFPLGVFGVALGTVLFPLLTRHAERGRLDLLRRDLALGLRLVLCVGVPASAGLMLLAGPLTSLLFERGAFDADDARQTAAMIVAYGSGVWAYCGLLIVHRGYYAVGDRLTPLRVGLLAVVVNLVLNFTLIWPLGGRGLALGTSVASMLQCVVVTLLIQKRIGPLAWSQIGRTALRVLAATALMAAACVATLAWLETGDDLSQRTLRVVVPLVVSIATFLLSARRLRLDEVSLLLRRSGNIGAAGDSRDK